MNVSGLQYSKATVGLRQNQSITDQHSKLVFIYPIIVDESVSTYTDLIRDFISVNMLKEIFVGNALNVVSMASHIFPISDERGNKINQAERLLSLQYGQTPGGSTFSATSGYSNPDKEEIKRRVQEKTAVIRKYLEIDPKLKSLRPYIEMITMENLIDVPVIVGTKADTADSLVLLLMTMVGIADPGRNLKTIDSVNSILDDIADAPAGNYANIFNMIFTKNTPFLFRARDWVKNTTLGNKILSFSDRKLGTNILSMIPEKKFEKNSPIPSRSLETLKDYKSPSAAYKKTFTSNPFMGFSNLIRTNVSKVKNSFRYCLDGKALQQKYGINISSGQVSDTLRTMTLQIDPIFDNIVSSISDRLSRFGVPLIMSYTNIYYKPDSGIKTAISDSIHAIGSEIYNLVNVDLKPLIMSIGDKADTYSEKLNKLKTLCGEELDNINTGIDKISAILEKHTIHYPLNVAFKHMSTPRYGEPELKDTPEDQRPILMAYMASLKTAAYQSQIINDRIKNSLKLLFSFPDLKTIDNSIENMFFSFFHELDKNLNDYDTAALMKAIHKGREDIQEYTTQYFKTLVYKSILVGICSFATEVDTNVETAASDALDFPNYTLILPVESIMAAGTALAAKSFQAFTDRANSFGATDKDKDNTEHFGLISKLNDNYVKGIVKVLHEKLLVPNLFVIDSKANTIYYKLMYQSDVQKMSVESLKTFTELVTKERLSHSNNQSPSYY